MGDRGKDDGADGHAGGRAAVAGLAALALVCSLLLGSIFFSFPSNVVSVRDGGSVRTVSVELIPQNWPFFTKPPNDPEVIPYIVHGDGRIEFASQFPNGRSENVFGLSRSQRAQGPEMANLANQVEEWVDCSGVRDQCVETAVGQGVAQTIHNSSPVATLCGTVVLMQTEPVPWSYRGHYDGWRLDKEAVLIEAEC